MINIDNDFVKSILPSRKQNSNKGDFGKVLCITGSKKYIGAGMLSAIAALRVGAGYSIFCTEELLFNEEFSFDLIYKTHDGFNINIIKNILDTENISSIVFGCGIGFDDKVINFTSHFLELLSNYNIKAVIDADGLNCIAHLKKHINNYNIIITPHPKELSRLLNVSVEEIQTNREKYVDIAQKQLGCIVLLKGHNSLIKTQDEIYVNSTGNNALAKAGTGDVLAGMIGGFLAQKNSCENATIAATYLHGLAADLYKQEYSEYSMLASDLLTTIPLAFKECLSQN